MFRAWEATRARVGKIFINSSSKGFLPMLAIAVLGLGIRLAAAAAAAVYRENAICFLQFLLPIQLQNIKQ